MLDNPRGNDQPIDLGQAALLRQAIASERAALLATYAEVEQ
jgi:anaerobic magnesium-protoporphyrin IX monomethyl ester cyclase